jgi:hypothetical protein
MSRSVNYNGITQYKPGGIAKTDVSALASVGLASNRIVGLIGEADGGIPMTAITIDDPALAEETYTSGPLADAIRIAFEPSGDDRVPGGAFRVICVKANETGASQSSRIFYAKVPPVLGANSGTDTTAAGSTTTVINITTGGLTVNAEVGNHLKIGSETREIISNTATTITVSPAFSSAPGANLALEVKAMQDYVAAPLNTTVITVANAGLTVDALIGNTLRIGTEERTITDNDATTITVGTAFTSTILGEIVEVLAPVFTLTSKDYGVKNNRIKQEFEPGSTEGHSWTTTLDDDTQTNDNLGAKSFLEVEYVGNSTRVTRASGTTDGAGSTTTLVDSTAGLTTNAETDYFVYADASGALDVVNIRKITSNTVTDIVVTNAFMTAADAATAPGIGTLYEVRADQIHTGTLAATSTSNTCTLETGVHVAANELAGMVIAITSGTGSGQRRVIASNTLGISSTVTVEKPWITQPDATSVYALRHVTEANVTITGAQGVSTTLTSSVNSNDQGSATDLNITFSQNETIQELVNTINQNSNYLAAVPNGINTLGLVSDFDFGSASYKVEIRNDKGAETTPSSRIYSSTSPQVPWLNNFRKDNTQVIDSFNNNNEFVTAGKSTSAGYSIGGTIPEYTGGVVGTEEDTFVYLSGGARGTSTNTDWQEAFDILIQNRVNHVVPLISEDLTGQGYGSTATFASVMAQLTSFVSDANGIEKNECGAYVGMNGSKTELITQATDFQDKHIQLTGQKSTWLNVSSTLTEMDEWATAVAAAGMRSGMDEVGEPLTWKYINTSTISQSSSWDPLDRTDANALIKAGVLFAEYIDNKGYRWVRDLTTYSRDDNLAKIQGSVVDITRYIAYGLRQYIENLFTGLKAKPTNATAIKDAVDDYMDQARTDNIIVDSINLVTGAIVRAYNNIRVKISGNVVTIRCNYFPAVGIEFELLDLHVQLPTQSA